MTRSPNSIGFEQSSNICCETVILMQKGIKPAQWCSKNTEDCWISIHQCHKYVEKIYIYHLVYYRVPNLNKSILFNEKSTQHKQQISKCVLCIFNIFPAMVNVPLDGN